MVRRFDRSIHIGLPKREDRFLYLKEKASSNPMFALSDEKLRQIATRSTGMSMAYLESVFEMALRMALRDQRNVVNDEMFDEAFETFTSGEKKKWDLGQLERVARHESGHALLCWESNQVPAYITIVARGNHGGYVQYEDREDQLLYTVQELRQRIRVSLGGRAAEIVYYGEEAGLSTGASGDLQSATKLARQLICQYGMDPDFGMAVINPQEDPSGAMAAQIREAVNRILNEELAAAIQIIREKKAVMDALTQQLLERNHISGSQLREFFTDI
jgi:ATP-dependent Zn protease